MVKCIHQWWLVYVLAMVFAMSSSAQDVVLHINSGDPQYPFPQFLNYTGGITLGRDNAIGVTDLEMECDIREAYQIFMNRATYTGEEQDGVKYIEFLSECKCNASCTEGDGYALIGAAYLADKTSFDGMWAWIHDQRMNLDNRYNDCSKINNETFQNITLETGVPGSLEYPYGQYTIGNCAQDSRGWKEADMNSAGDGDYDIAMGMLIAFYQWGDQKILTTDCGDDVTYRTELIKVLRGLTDTVFFSNNDWTCNQWVCPNGPDPRTDKNGDNGYYSGVIGLDGYFKSGNTFREVTSWNTYTEGGFYSFDNGVGMLNRSQKKSSTTTEHISYMAPSYFHAFADFLENEDPTRYAWNIHQFKRAEASSDWLMGKMNEGGHLPLAGHISIHGSNPTFTGSAEPAEDVRLPWRTILNYVWNGDPSYTWDPDAHEVDYSTGNSYEQLSAEAFGDHIKSLHNECDQIGNDPSAAGYYKGVILAQGSHKPDGSIERSDMHAVNWIFGTGAPSMVAYHKKHNNKESHDLLADWYRRLVLDWQNNNDDMSNFDENRYIKSLPQYFHGYFRLLGMLITTGNLHAPAYMKKAPKANLKVYKNVDKTLVYAPTETNGIQRSKTDTLTYTFCYRNYASVDALNASIEFDIPDEMIFHSASGTYTRTGNKIIWEFPKIDGYKSTGETSDQWKDFDPTQYNSYGEVTLKVTLKPNITETIICNQATIDATNSEKHTSNEYPYRKTATMERNCVDIGKRSLEISKHASKTVLKKDDEVLFDIYFQNSSEVGWLNGGRPDVRITYGNNLKDYTIMNYFRFLHGAQEAYINPGNYRFSYFINDGAHFGLKSPTNPSGWILETIILEGGDKDKVTYSSETYSYGEDNIGKYNQRLITRFPDTLMPSAQHAYKYFAKNDDPTASSLEKNNLVYIHKGTGAPFRMAVKMEASGGSPSCGTVEMKQLLTDDWSYEDLQSGDKDIFYPVEPGWFNTYSSYDETLQEPINEIHIDACPENAPSRTYDKILIEEFDGYVWRRVMGNGPVPGRELSNVVILDTLPDHLVWGGFKNEKALGVKASYDQTTRVIKWEIPALLPGANGHLSYYATAQTDCSQDYRFTSSAWIKSDTDSPVDSAVKMLITCENIPDTLIGGSTMYKTSDKTTYIPDDEVEYTVSLRQTDGTISEPDLSTTDNWEVHCGLNMPDFKKTSLGNNAPALITYKHSHGTNGVLQTVIAPELSQPFSLIFRHNGGSPDCGAFKGLQLTIVNNSCGEADISLFENGVLIDSKLKRGYRAPMDTMTIRVELEGDKLMVWLNNFNAIPYTFEGITYMEPGHVGFYNTKETGNSNPSHAILSWFTNFDSAFDVEIYDDIPDLLSYETGSETVTYNENGSYSSLPNFNATTNRLSWKVVKGDEPMLFGDSVALTFKTKVVSCGPGHINNIAFANMLGQPEHKIFGQAISTCKNDQCLIPTTADIIPAKDSVNCFGQAIDINTSVDIAGSYTYLLSEGGVERDRNTTGEFSITSTGTYKVIVIDPADELGCRVESPAYTYTITNDPDYTLSIGDTLCKNSNASFIPAISPVVNSNFTYTTYVNGVAESVINPALYPVGDYDVISEVNTGTCVYYDTASFYIHETEAPKGDDYFISFGDTNPLMEITVDSDATEIEWYKTKEVVPTPLSITNTYTETETAVGVYTYYFTQKVHGCWSDLDSLQLTISECAIGKPIVTNDSICLSGTPSMKDLSTLAILSGVSTFEWTDSTNTVVSPLQTFTTPGIYNFKVKGYDQTNSCWGGSSTVSIKVFAEPTDELNVPSAICSSTESVLLYENNNGNWNITINNQAFPHDAIVLARDNFSENHPYSVVGEYTDEHGCSITSTKDFIIGTPAKPAIQNRYVSREDLPQPDFVALGSGTIYWLDTLTQTDTLAVGPTYNPSYEENRMVTAIQKVGECYSDTASARLYISDCDINSPVLVEETIEHCLLASSNATFTVQAENGYSYYWNGSNTSSETFTFAETVAGTYIATVIADNGDCQSSPVQATYIIKDTPAVSIDIPDPLCGGNNYTIEASLSPTPTIESIFLIDGNREVIDFNLSTLSEGDHTVSYQYISTSECTNETSKTITITKTDPIDPQPTFSELLSNPPTGIIDLSAESGELLWYTNSDLSDTPVQSSVYTHSETSVTGVWKYYVTRAEKGCESTPTEITYVITDCELETPVITGPQEICWGDAVTLSTENQVTGTVINWYDKSGQFITSGDQFSPTLTSETTTFYAEREGHCTTGQNSITITQVELDAPEFTITGNTEICKGNPIPFFNYAGQDSAIWYKPDGTIQNYGNSLAVDENQYALGENEYTLKVFTRGTLQCESPVSTATFTVTEAPGAPTLVQAPKPTCMSEPFANATVSATGTTHWYEDENCTNEIIEAEGLSEFARRPSSSNQTVYVKQSINGCLSKETLTIEYTKIPKPEEPIIEDIEICHSIISVPELSPTNALGYTVEWTMPDGNITQAESITPTRETATYTLQFIDDNNCRGALKDVNVTYTTPPTPNISVNKNIVCADAPESILLQTFVQRSSTSFDGYQIQTPSSTEEGSTLDINTSLSSAGNYYAQTYTMIDRDKCFSEKSNTETISIIDYIDKPIVSDDELSACLFDLPTITLSPARSNDTLYLSRNKDKTDVLAESTTNTYDPNTFDLPAEDTVYAWAKNQCYSELVSIAVTTYSLPEIPTIESVSPNFSMRNNTISICQGDIESPEIFATGLNTEFISWIDEQGNAIASDNEHVQLPVPPNTTSGVFQYAIEVQSEYGCINYANIMYEVKPLPTPTIANMAGDTEYDIICEKDAFSYYQVLNANETSMYTWSNSTDNSSVINENQNSNKTISIRPYTSGVDTLFVTENQNGCTNTDSYLVYITPVADADFSYVKFVDEGYIRYENESMNPPLQDLDYSVWYDWSFNGDHIKQTNDEVEQDPYIEQATSPGNISVTLTAKNAGGEKCYNSKPLSINMPAVTGLFFPTSFSPRNDGKLIKVWRPMGKNLKSYEVWLYDNWGNIVWYSNSIKNGAPVEAWTGLDKNGVPVTGDIYTYKVNATFTDGTKWKNENGKSVGNIIRLD